jgi:hypothetical protein
MLTSSINIANPLRSSFFIYPSFCLSAMVEATRPNFVVSKSTRAKTACYLLPTPGQLNPVFNFKSWELPRFIAILMPQFCGRCPRLRVFGVTPLAMSN